MTNNHNQNTYNNDSTKMNTRNDQNMSVSKRSNLNCPNESCHHHAHSCMVKNDLKETLQNIQDDMDEEVEMFYASGPFYTQLEDYQLTSSHQFESSKCNVLYAEMPSTSTKDNSPKLMPSNSDLHKSLEISKNLKDEDSIKFRKIFVDNSESKQNNSLSQNQDNRNDNNTCLIHLSSLSNRLNSQNTSSPVGIPKSHITKLNSCALSLQKGMKISSLNKKIRKTLSSPSNSKHKSNTSLSFESSNDHKQEDINSIRVLKPTAIRADMFGKELACDRLSASVTDISCDGNFCVDQTTFPKPSLSSAFNQLDSKNTIKLRKNHQRSNSLSETLICQNNSMVDSQKLSCSPFSLENVSFKTPIGNMSKHCKKLDSIKIDSSTEPIHMTLEEVRQIAFRSDEVPFNSSQIEDFPDSNDDEIDSFFNRYRSLENKANNRVLNVSPDSTETLTTGGNNSNPSVLNERLQTAKAKIKLLFDHILNRTYCIGHSDDNENNICNDSHLNGSKHIYKVNTSCNRPSASKKKPYEFVPKGFRFVNFDENAHTFADNINEISDDLNATNGSHQAFCEERENMSPAFSVSESSPFVRRALPPLPTSKTIVNRSSNDILTTDCVTNDQKNSQPIANEAPTCSKKQDLSSKTIIVEGINNSQTIGDHQPLETQQNTSSQFPIQTYSSAHFKSMSMEEKQRFLDYASSIERVKHCGWYWGPISGEMAEKLLETEPCGSFLVRDSSDEHYIFSLTFKLDGMVRHVRIEHDQGNFSFGTLQKFRSTTIVDFIESAVEHSRSGRFLFFLHRRPVMGPIRVQLLHPVSRFKRVQSLQHNCRFTILRHVRRDQINKLSLPEYLKRYLDTPYYYSEELANLEEVLFQEENKMNKIKFEEEKRKFFLQTDPKTLLSKMMIDHEEIEQKLKITSINSSNKNANSSSSVQTQSTSDETNGDQPSIHLKMKTTAQQKSHGQSTQKESEL